MRLEKQQLQPRCLWQIEIKIRIVRRQAMNVCEISYLKNIIRDNINDTTKNCKVISGPLNKNKRLWVKKI